MVKRKPIWAIAISVLVFATALSAFAQGRYGNVYSRNDVSNFIRNLENSSDVFSRDFNRTRGTTTTERRYVSRFEDAVDRLRSRFDSNDSWWQSRNEVQSIMDEARSVNTMMNNERFARSLEVQWRNLRRDINKLADTYELPELGGGGGRFPGGGFPGNPVGGNVPSWARGTFYGRSPINGETITMTIVSNGTVTIHFSSSGQTNYATLNRQTLWNNGIQSRVTSIRNGIRTTRTDNGEVIDYYRTNQGPVYPTYPGAGVGGNVPTWAQGSFYGRNPQTGGTITLNISSNGSVSINFDNGGQTMYATMNGTTLLNNGIQSRVSRTRNGIRTTRLDNGEVIDYRRR